MRKLLSYVLIGAMTVGLLAGCSSGGSGGSGNGGATQAAGSAAGSAAATEAAKSGEVKTLSVVWFSDGKEGESFMKLADQYMAENPNIKIELIEVPYADLEAKVKNMINGKESPALARLTNIGPFQNQLLDLGEYVSDKDAFVNSFGEGLKFVFDGKVLAAPMDVTANGLIYNTPVYNF